APGEHRAPGAGRARGLRDECGDAARPAGAHGADAHRRGARRVAPPPRRYGVHRGRGAGIHQRPPRAPLGGGPGGRDSECLLAGIEESLSRLRVRFDVWTTEGSLHRDGWVERAVDQLRSAGHIYEQDGATWFRSTAFGDDKDRVVLRSNGQPTYFASDIGYL